MMKSTHRGVLVTRLWYLRQVDARRVLNTGISRDVIFFQAEDGIRDLTVTGVQTCALPIFELADDGAARLLFPLPGALQESLPADVLPRLSLVGELPLEDHVNGDARVVGPREIGRASCRERV